MPLVARSLMIRVPFFLFVLRLLTPVGNTVQHSAGVAAVFLIVSTLIGLPASLLSTIPMRGWRKRQACGKRHVVVEDDRVAIEWNCGSTVRGRIDCWHVGAMQMCQDGYGYGRQTGICIFVAGQWRVFAEGKEVVSSWKHQFSQLGIPQMRRLRFRDWTIGPMVLVVLGRVGGEFAARLGFGNEPANETHHLSQIVGGLIALVSYLLLMSWTIVPRRQRIGSQQ